MMKMQISGNHTADICKLTVDIANVNLQTRGKNYVVLESHYQLSRQV